MESFQQTFGSPLLTTFVVFIFELTTEAIEAHHGKILCYPISKGG